MFDSVAGTTLLGIPTQVRHIGYTYETRRELHSYIVRQLQPEFTQEKYDILTHNCNHFSDQLVLFLLNQHIPDDVLHLADNVMSTHLAGLLRPLLNR